MSSPNQNFLIHSRNSYNSKAKLELDFRGSTSEYINQYDNQQKPPHLQHYEDKNVDIVKEKLDHIEKYEQLPTNIKVIDLYQFTICYLLQVALLIWLVKKCGYCGRRVKINPTTQVYEDIELHLHVSIIFGGGAKD